MNKWIKIAIGTILGAFTLYHSIYIQPLEERRAENDIQHFDARAFVDGIWTNDLRASFATATDIAELYQGLRAEPQSTFDEYAQALGIGNIAYFKVKGNGRVSEVNENNVILQIGSQAVELETEFIFGNAIRDASGLIQINDYQETSDFNSISEAINDRIRAEVIPAFRSSVTVGDEVSFEGAVELNKVHLDLGRPEVIPLSIQISE